MPVSASDHLNAHDRLLAAAERVFAQRGLVGATTREIAQEAGVNEVTLFRHFRSKQGLLAAVIEHVFAAPAEPAADIHSSGLRGTLETFAQTYAGRLRRNFALIRVLVGEIQHCDEQEVRVLREVFRPQRQELIAALREAQVRREVREDASLPITADQFAGMIFIGILRGSMPLTREYGAERYLEECVETMVRALAP
jgi:AcrR family transcriptional regulator